VSRRRRLCGLRVLGPIALECIGCGFDGRPPARVALTEALALATAARARLRLIAILEPTAFGHLTVAPPLDLRTVNASLRSTLQQKLDDAAAELRQVESEPVLLDGDPGERLSEHTQSLDLLVLGSRGNGPLRSLLLGGVSAHLIRTASCPVVVCPADPDADDSPKSKDTADRD